MEIFIERTRQTIQKDFVGQAKQLLIDLHIIPEDVLIVKNGSLVTEDEELKEQDKVQLLSVISGG